MTETVVGPDIMRTRIVNLIETGERGDRLTYYVGFLARDAGLGKSPLAKLRDMVQAEQKSGRLHLRQQRISEWRYRYFVVVA